MRSLVILLFAMTLSVSGWATGNQEPTREQLTKRIDRDHNDLSSASARHDLEVLSADLQKRVAAHPKEAWLHLLLGRIALYLHHDDSARAELDTAAKLTPNDGEVILFQAYSRLSANDEKTAIRLLKRAEELSPEDPRPLVGLGEIYLDQKRDEEARQVLTKACAMHGARAYTFGLLGNALADLGQFDAAYAQFEKALQLDPQDADAHYNAGLYLASKGDLQHALAHFQAFEKAYPGDAMGHIKLLEMYQGLGRRSERDAERRQIIALHRAGSYRAPEFGRETFAVGPRQVIATEVFDPKPPFNVKYRFTVFASTTGAKALMMFTLESDDRDQEVEKELGRSGEGRVYTVDSYEPGGRHATYEFFHGEPTYEEVRDLVIRALKNAKAPLSSSHP